MICFSIGYSTKLIYSLQKDVVTNIENISYNTELLKTVDSLTREIQAEQIKRTKNVYSVPFIQKQIEVAPELLSGIVVCDKEGKIVDMTTGAEILLNIPPAVLGTISENHSIFSFMPKEQVQSHKNYLTNQKLPPKLMDKAIDLFDRRIKISVQYLTTQEFYIINMKEI